MSKKARKLAKRKAEHQTEAAQSLHCQSPNSLAVDAGRGSIKDNYLAALVTSKVYRMQVEKAKKGKGSFSRKNKHKGREPYLMAA